MSLQFIRNTHTTYSWVVLRSSLFAVRRDSVEPMMMKEEKYRSEIVFFIQTTIKNLPGRKWFEFSSIRFFASLRIRKFRSRRRRRRLGNRESSACGRSAVDFFPSLLFLRLHSHIKSWPTSRPTTNDRPTWRDFLNLSSHFTWPQYQDFVSSTRSYDARSAEMNCLLPWLTLIASILSYLMRRSIGQQERRCAVRNWKSAERAKMKAKTSN